MILISEITSDPPGIITSNFFGYHNTYFTVDQIQPGKGYWVKVDRIGELILSSSGNNTSVTKIRITPTNELPPPAPRYSDDVPENTPLEFALLQNYPNPFNPTTRIKYDLPSDSRVTIKIYNLLGQEVATLVDGMQEAGYKSVEWNASDFPSGVYIYRLSAEAEGKSFMDVKKVVLLR
jgi:hypothetical protein